MDISVKTGPRLENPNSHIFATKKHQSESKIDYTNLKQDNSSRQPVLFEHMTEIHLTRSKYVITSFVKFDQYYRGFQHLKKFSTQLLAEISKLSETEMPYFIRRYKEKENTLQNLFRSHKEEATHLIEMLEKYKLKFDKLLDHMTPEQPRRTKRSVIHSIFNFLFGSGDSNSETIEQIKKNLDILEQNQQNIGDELMRQLEMIDQSNIQIGQNRAVINALSGELIQLNSSLNSVSEGIKELEFSKNFILAMLQVRNRLDMMRDGMNNLKEDLNKISEYMTSLTSHKVTPNLIPPTDLRDILQDVNNKLVANPKLTLPVHKEADIWSYYQFLKIDAFVHRDILIVVLILPLIDKDLEFDLFKAHNLPLLHPELKKVFTYDLDNSYIALRSDSNYFTIPMQDDILTCTISAGHFCNLNTPLYPVRSTTECIYHLLVNDAENIEKFCHISMSDYAHDSAINLQANVWALAVLEPTELHVTCLTYSYQIKIKTNFRLVELENSCQAYNPNIILPSGNQLTERQNGSIIRQRFFNYDIEYSAIPNFFLMRTFNLTQLTKKQISMLTNELPPIARVQIRNVTEMLKSINRNYPFVFPLYGYILLACGGTVVVILIIGILYYAKYRRAKATIARPKHMLTANDIEMKPLNVQATKEQVKDPLQDNSVESTKVTPSLLQKKLENDLGIDFSSYEKFKRRHTKSQQHADEFSKIV